MTALAIKPMPLAQIERVRALETENASKPQVEIPIHQVLHAGIYTRHILIPPDTTITGALIKRSTLLTVVGDVVLTLGEDCVELNGVNVIPASADRKQAFVARSYVFLSMQFATNAKTTEEAEAEFTDEGHLLARTSRDTATVTGE